MYYILVRLSWGPLLSVTTHLYFLFSSEIYIFFYLSHIYTSKKFYIQLNFKNISILHSIKIQNCHIHVVPDQFNIKQQRQNFLKRDY